MSGDDDDDDGDDNDDYLPLNQQQRDQLHRTKDRRRKKESSTVMQDIEGQDNNDGSHVFQPEKSLKEIREEQRRQMSQDEFGGECVLCLEPDEESKHKLQELREAIREGLDHDPYSSPSSIYSWDYVSDEIDTGVYRPLIPISKFDTFPAAMDVARRLKGVWGDPLTLHIRDLHLISCYDNNEGEYNDREHLYQNGMYPNTIFLGGNTLDENNHHAVALSTQVGGILQNKNYHHVSLESKDESWGCNAKIMLMGEELQQDDEETGTWSIYC